LDGVLLFGVNQKAVEGAFSLRWRITNDFVCHKTELTVFFDRIGHLEIVSFVIGGILNALIYNKNDPF
jgi:hypothetical protein